jgi:hypothetical protein
MRKVTAIFLLLAAGCASGLDSGYEPRRLSATDAQRRAYYSSPFSEETQQALHEDRFAQPQAPTRY